MSSEQDHSLTRIGTDDDLGLDVYECNRCGRRIALGFVPHRKIVLVPGDETAVHVGGKGPATMHVLETHTVVRMSNEDTDWLRDHGVEP